MIEELQLLRDIFGDLTGFGMYAIGFYIAYKLITFGSVCYLIKFAIEKLFAFFKADITKEEADIIRRGATKAECENKELQATINANCTKHDAELEKIKHMYKILKEAKGEPVSE